MAQKKISSIMDILGIAFIIEQAKKDFFPSSSKLGDEEFEDICIQIQEDYKRKISKSSIHRIFNVLDKPHPCSYRSLDIITVWCFDNKYSNFKELLQKKEDDIKSANFITVEKAQIVLDSIYKKPKVITTPKNISIDLANVPISFHLGEGFIKKLIQEVSIVTGNLLTDKIKDNPREFGIYTKPSITQRLILKETRRQNNIEKIIVKAIDFSREREASSEPVDPDWIVEFFNIAQDCSNDNLQYLWAKLLASEIDKPNSISRRTLSIIKLLESKEAQVFTTLCNCVWTLFDTTEFKEKVLIKDLYDEENYSDETWGFDSMFIPHLESIGLVGESFIDMVQNRIYKLDFFGKVNEIKSRKKQAQLEIITLTKAGKEVFNIIKPTPNTNYYNFTIDYFKKVEILYR